jgi:RNAse (barnase) inhibitor barstar
MANEIIINGSNISDIPSLYREINRVFMYNEDWQIGESLDALDDLLYGSYSAVAVTGITRVVWTDIEQCKKALDYETTKSYYLGKLQPGSPFNKPHFTAKLKELEAGNGETYFDIVVGILLSHSNIELIMQNSIV